MGLGLLLLVSVGKENIYLSSEPEITFFKISHKRYTNFSIDTIAQYFKSTPDFGRRVTVNLSKNADLLEKLYLYVELPDIIKDNPSVLPTGVKKFAWVKKVGLALINYVDLEIGGVLIERHYGDYLNIWGELVVNLGKKKALHKMIGNIDLLTNYTNGKTSYSLYVPLNFWFCKSIGASLPLVSIQTQDVRIIVTFRQYGELIISSDGFPLKLRNQNLIQIQQTFLDVDYIFLEDEERRFFARNNHQYLIEQVQVFATSLTTNGLRQDPTDPNKMTRIPDLNQNILLSFNHPVKELFWVIQNSNVLSIYPYGGNEWFNFSTQSYKNGVANGTDPMNKGKLIFEGQDLFDVKPSKYFRTVVPFQRHTNVPNNYIYCYSFSFHPEEFQPSGTCNFSRIDNQVLYMEISDQLIDPIITVFALNQNILNIAGGMAGVEYSN